MQTSGFPALAVASLLVLAGCSAPVIDLDEANRPPGVRDDRVVWGPMLTAHTTALRNESYTVRFHHESPQSTVSGFYAVAADHEHARVRVQRTVGDRWERVSIYVDANSLNVRFASSEAPTRYQASSRDSDTIRFLRNDLGMIAGALPALRQLRLEPVATTGRRGDTLVVLAGNDTIGARFHDRQPTHARVLVSERGVIHHVEYTSPPGQANAPTVTTTWTLTAVGQTRVSRPAWVDTVENRNGLVRPRN